MKKLPPKANYYVTDVQGAKPMIAGIRRGVGSMIELTDHEAEFEVTRGTVELSATREMRLAAEREEPRAKKDERSTK